MNTTPHSRRVLFPTACPKAFLSLCLAALLLPSCLATRSQVKRLDERLASLEQKVQTLADGQARLDADLPGRVAVLEDHALADAKRKPQLQTEIANRRAVREATQQVAGMARLEPDPTPAPANGKTTGKANGQTSGQTNGQTNGQTSGKADGAPAAPVAPAAPAAPVAAASAIPEITPPDSTFPPAPPASVPPAASAPPKTSVPAKGKAPDAASASATADTVRRPVSKPVPRAPGDNGQAGAASETAPPVASPTPLIKSTPVYQTPKDQKPAESAKAETRTDPKAKPVATPDAKPVAKGKPDAKPDAKPAAKPDPKAAAQARHDEAVALIQAGKVDRGRQLLNAFIKENPKHPLQPSALYWLGESYYADKRYAQAILTFKDVTGKHPKHDKAPAALLRIGLAYEQLGDKANARFHLGALVKEYPKSDAARQAKDALEGRLR